MFWLCHQINSNGKPTDRESTALLLGLLLTHCLSWWLVVRGLSSVVRQDHKAAFWLQIAATTWQVLLIVYQIVGLPFLVFITALSSGMPPQD